MERDTLEVGPRLIVNKSGYWTLAAAEKGADGKWRNRQLSCRTKDRIAAEAFRRAYVAANSGVDPDRPLTVGDLIAGYRLDCEDRRVGHGTLDALKPVEQLLGAYRPEELTVEVQRAYRQARKVGPGTLRRDLGALRAAFGWGVKAQRLKAHEVPEIGLPKTPAGRREFLDEVEEAALWDAASRDEDERGRLSVAGRFVCLALGTGARSGAVVGLTWRRVDLVGGSIDFREPGMVESNKERVATRISRRLRPVLERMHAEKEFDRLVVGTTLVRWPVRHLLARCGVRREITPHSFRHTYITLGLRAGVSTWDMAGLVGASEAMIHKVYGHHVADSHLQRAADLRFLKEAS